LVIGGQETVAYFGERGGVGGGGTEIVDTFVDEGEAYAGVGDYITLDTGEGRGAKAVIEDAVASCGKI
jgi:hypothetical protein